MILNKQTYWSDNFEFHNTILELVKSVNFLCFQISYNSNFGHIIGDCVSKAEKMGNMVLQVIKTDSDVSVNDTEQPCLLPLH